MRSVFWIVILILNSISFCLWLYNAIDDPGLIAGVFLGINGYNIVISIIYLIIPEKGYPLTIKT